MFLRKDVLKICSKFTREHQNNFIEITLRHGCSPVNMLHIFRIPFPRNTSEWLLVYIALLVSVETHLLVWSTLNFCYVNFKAVDLCLQFPLSSSLFLFLSILSFPLGHYHRWTWFCVLFRYITVLLDSWVQVIGFSRFHQSIDFVLLPHIESLYVTWRRRCYQEVCHFPQKVYILFLFLLIYLPTIAD